MHCPSEKLLFEVEDEIRCDVVTSDESFIRMLLVGCTAFCMARIEQPFLYLEGRERCVILILSLLS